MFHAALFAHIKSVLAMPEFQRTIHTNISSDFYYISTWKINQYLKIFSYGFRQSLLCGGKRTAGTLSPATEFLRYSLLILTFQKLCPQKANGIFCNSSRTRFAPLRVLGRSRSQQYTGLLLCTARPSRPKRSPNIEKQQTQ